MVKSVRVSSPATPARRSRPERPLYQLIVASICAMTMEGGYAGPRPSGSLVPTRSEVIATHIDQLAGAGAGSRAISAPVP